MPDFLHVIPIRDDNCAVAAKRHRACSAPRHQHNCLTFQCGEGDGEGELETQYFTTSAMSQPAVANVLQREKIQSAHVPSRSLTEEHKPSSFEEQLDVGV